MTDNAELAPPLVVIVGTTASGKSALGMVLAQHFNGEIICADSRTVYTGMNIGTAKPPLVDQKSVRHHLLDVVEPDRTFTAADFKRRAGAAIEEISARNRLPIMVGGTGLYIDSVLYDFRFGPVADARMRAKLNALPVASLQTLHVERGIALPENSQNVRYLVRSLETNGRVPSRGALRPGTLIIGLTLPREQLQERIVVRVNTMVEAGFIEEVRTLMDRYSWDLDALRTPGYKAFGDLIDGKIDLQTAKALFVQSDLQLAKRQYTWFKRNKSIHWVSSVQEAHSLVKNFLSNLPSTG